VVRKAAAVLQEWAQVVLAKYSHLRTNAVNMVSTWLTVTRKLITREQPALSSMSDEPPATAAAAPPDSAVEDDGLGLCSLASDQLSGDYLNSSTMDIISDLSTLDSVLHQETLDSLRDSLPYNLLSADGSELTTSSLAEPSFDEVEHLQDLPADETQSPTAQLQDGLLYDEQGVVVAEAAAAAVESGVMLTEEGSVVMLQDDLGLDLEHLPEADQVGMMADSPDLPADSPDLPADISDLPADSSRGNSTEEAPWLPDVGQGMDSSTSEIQKQSGIPANVSTAPQPHVRHGNIPIVVPAALVQLPGTVTELLSSASPASLTAAALGVVASILSGLSLVLALALVRARAGQQAAARALKHATSEHAQAIAAVETAHSEWQAAMREAHASDMARLEAAGSVALVTLSQQHSKALAAAHAAGAAQVTALRQAHASEVSKLRTQLAQARKALRSLQASSSASVKANISVQRLLQAGILSAVTQLKVAKADQKHLETQLQAVKQAVAQQQQKAATQLLRAEKQHAQVGCQHESHTRCEVRRAHDSHMRGPTLSVAFSYKMLHYAMGGIRACTTVL
jgi:hypothetical protein